MFFYVCSFAEITTTKKIIFTQKTSSTYHTQLNLIECKELCSTEDNNWNETDTCRNRFLAFNIDEPF